MGLYAISQGEVLKSKIERPNFEETKSHIFLEFEKTLFFEWVSQLLFHDNTHNKTQS
jgi:hypothetical protein